MLAVVAGSSFASDNCEGAFKCGSETAGQNPIIRTRGRKSVMQGRQRKTPAYANENPERQSASKTHSLALPLCSPMGNGLDVFGLKSTDIVRSAEHFHPRCIPLFLLSLLFLCHRPETDTTLNSLQRSQLLPHSESCIHHQESRSFRDKCSHAAAIGLAEANKPFGLFPCF